MSPSVQPKKKAKPEIPNILYLTAWWCILSYNFPSVSLANPLTLAILQSLKVATYFEWNH
jgi:hypothetical protein